MAFLKPEKNCGFARVVGVFDEDPRLFVLYSDSIVRKMIIRFGDEDMDRVRVLRGNNRLRLSDVVRLAQDHPDMTVSLKVDFHIEELQNTLVSAGVTGKKIAKQVAMQRRKMEKRLTEEAGLSEGMRGRLQNHIDTTVSSEIERYFSNEWGRNIGGENEVGTNVGD